MRTIRKRVMAVCMAALLLVPALTVLAEAETVEGMEIAATVSGGDATVESGNGENAEDQIMTYAGGDIASGTNESGSITWVIDASGKLTVNGTGDLSGHASYNFAWRPYSSQITSAEINVTGMTDASSLFSGCNNMTSIDMRDFDTSNVVNMGEMFEGCGSLTSLDISNFDTSNVRNMRYMFSGCSSLTSLDVSNFNTINVNDMESMFLDCSGLMSLNVSGFDTGNVTNMMNMFRNCASLTSLNIDTFNTGKVTDMSWMFSGCKSLENLSVSGLDTHSVYFMHSMFQDCDSLLSVDVRGFDTSNVWFMDDMFRGCSNLTSLDISNFDTSNVTSMTRMFSGCSSLTSLDVSNFDTRNVTNMGEMFLDCSSLMDLDASGFDTSRVTSMGLMFHECSSLMSLDVGGFDTANVTNMNAMFAGCSSLTNLDVGGFDTSNVTHMGMMFMGCSGLTGLDLTGFDTANVTNMNAMFLGCSALRGLDISGFDIGNVTEDSLSGTMFGDCANLISLQSPYNVNLSVSLPVVQNTVWLLPDGTEVTELPQGLSYSVTLTRSGTPITPQITTTTPDLNMEDVVRVKYVPYSYTVETDNTDTSNTVTFSIEEGRLAEGVELYPATGEIYGVPLEAGEFKIKVKATYSNPAYIPAYAELRLTVLDNTDANVGVATDYGYDITQPVTGFDMDAMAGSGAQTLVSQGEYSQFRDVYIDGRKLTAGQDYTSESGSTRITILNQTLADGGTGIHTLGIEFRTENGTLKRAAQNYVISSTTSGSDNTGSDNNSNNSSSHSGNNSSAVSDNNDSPLLMETSQWDFIIYTVERGDSLWKIAERFYGKGHGWRIIYQDNAAIIKNPGRLYAGQKLVIRLTGNAVLNPFLETSAPVSDEIALAGTSYRVQKGDSLWTIARRAYGSGRLWNIIYEANKDVIADVERISEGQEIIIPQR
ncbi:MAG: BspA family leucine-rich repeat surface protein [Lachnospiraceae bacterium]|nr:BspA family leucine-rich repeat surface protein [Lachnospiraceae bacterium]